MEIHILDNANVKVKILADKPKEMDKDELNLLIKMVLTVPPSDFLLIILVTNPIFLGFLKNL